MSDQPNLTVSDIRVFVPAKDFDQSLRFYTALGWSVLFKVPDNNLAALELGANRFLLQNFYAKEWAENFMFQILVEDAQAWYDHVSVVLAAGDYGTARVTPPKEEHYGALVTYVWDPSGVLLHFTQFLTSE